MYEREKPLPLAQISRYRSKMNMVVLCCLLCPLCTGSPVSLKIQRKV